ncbi:MAG: Rne/Rng family ribonuclease [Mobiluncus porci]|uniref:Rne/Rng family ribonuclease n=1 Tax=Mobiluncus porci TaxID=2652278 RepID=UPI0023F3AEE6|nr:Rne/Rng family ribonuclease [Mobiluncus porci]MDD7542242.1 Rne/Rng family ribonuclease [Mobiluncus porci]MDY5749041.1 Rne/Rng family ribonuclease [Mobiluncus porci]
MTTESTTNATVDKNATGEKKASSSQNAPALALPAANLLFQAPDLSGFTAVSNESTEKRHQNRRDTNRGEEDSDNNSNESKRTRRRKNSEESEKPQDKTHSRSNRKNETGENGEKNTSSSSTNNENYGTTKRRQSRNQNQDTTCSESENQEPTRRRRHRTRSDADANTNPQVQALEGSTRLEAKRIRRKAGRKESRRRTPITEAEFLARRESVKREMVVRERDGLNQVAILEDGLLVEHYVSRHTQTSMVGNIYLGKVQNVLSSMEAAFVDIGKGRNAVLYAGEVNWDAAGLNSKTGRIEDALNPGDLVLVQVTKDPIGHKGARLTSQITLAGRHLVLVPSGAMTGISRKLPEEERKRLKTLLKTMIPSSYGVIVRTAAEGASEEQLRNDVDRLVKIWEDIDTKRNKAKNGPLLLHGEPELAVRVVRDIFNEDFTSLTIQGDEAWRTISKYVGDLSPELKDRLQHWKGEDDIFAAHRVDEQLAKGFERKVWLPSGGYLIIDRTEAMTVIDVNTGRYIGAGGTLEETVTKNNLEAAEEIVRQLRLRDIGGIVVIDFVDMVIESNRDLVLRRLVECLGRDRTRHQVTEITSLGLVQMTRKRVGQGLVEAFSTQCECCDGRGFIVHDVPVENNGQAPEDVVKHSTSRRGSTNSSTTKRGRGAKAKSVKETKPEVRQTMAGIAAAAHAQDEVEEPETVDTIKLNDFEEQSPEPQRPVKELTRGKDKPALGAAAGRLELGNGSDSASGQPRRRHRRAASTGVINTDADGADIVVTDN